MRGFYLLVMAASAVAQIPTSTTLSVSANPVPLGAPTTVTVTVAPAATGTVVLYDRSTEITRRVLTNSAVAVPLRLKAPGTSFLRAVYTGSATHAPSTSTEIPVRVTSQAVSRFMAGVAASIPANMPDLNYDGIPDAFVASERTISIRFGVAGGGLANPVVSQLPIGVGFHGFGDFNSDGYVDVLGWSAWQLQVLAGAPGGTITSTVLDTISLPLGGIPLSVSITDANADGFPDVVFSVSLGMAGTANGARFSNGKGKFLAQSDFQGGVYLGDRNGDGLPELARTYWTYIGRYAGPRLCNVHFSPAYTDSIPCGAHADASIPGVADVDGDGHLDLVSASSPITMYGGPGLALLRANPAGGYFPPTTYTVPYGQEVIGVADMNNDGRADVVSRQENAVAIRYGLAEGTLSGPVFLAAPGMPAGVISSLWEAWIADETGDGIPDIVVQDQSVRTIWAGIAGTLAPAAAPTTVSATSGVGMSGIIIAEYQDANGAFELSVLNLLVSASVNGTNACLIEVNTAMKTARLMANSGGAWETAQRIGPGADSISNSQCTVATGSMSVEAVGNSIKIRVPVTFAPSFVGLKKIFLKAVDAGGLETPFEERGQWNIAAMQPPPVSVPSGVSVNSLQPVTGEGTTARFRAVFQHSAGKHYLGYILLLPTPNVVQYTALGSCLIEYNRISNGMRLINDAGDGWIGRLEGVRIGGAAELLENAQCAVNPAAATAQIRGDTMVVEATVTFKAGMAGVLGTFLQAFDTEGKFTGMTQFGNWVAPGTNHRSGPRSVAVTLERSAGVYNLGIAAAHTAGADNLSAIHVRIGARIIGAPVCHIVYFPSTKRMNLVNDAETGLVSDTWIEPGAGTLSNSQCTVFGPGSGSADAQGAYLFTKVQLNPVTFAGFKYVYMNVFDNNGLLTHWVTTNSVTVN